MNTVLKPKVFVAMSGGVDSSVAAALLKYGDFPAGSGPALNWDVVGVHMKCWSAAGSCGAQDAEDARRAAGVLKIPFYVWNFEDEYKKRVVDYMIAGYKNGLTPNPDVVCNREIKFGIFLQRALQLGADFVATGHYMRLRELKTQNSKLKTYVLATARDLNKDQSYFLWTLTQKQLRHCIFPIGEYTKPEVRAMAKEFGLANAEKKDSQGICFIGKISVADFLKEKIGVKTGAIMTTLGTVVGAHDGAYQYTIGQRHGLGIGGGTPYFVVNKDTERNVVYVAPKSEKKEFLRSKFSVTNLNWVRGNAPKFPLRAKVRVRYRQPLTSCMVLQEEIRNPKSEIRNKSQITNLKFQTMLHVKLNKPVWAVAAGQSAVFYDLKGKEMLGGGIITQVLI